MPDQTELIKLLKGDDVNHFLMIRKFEPRTTKVGKPFISLELGDQSLSIEAVIWDNTEGFSDLAESGGSGKVVYVSGKIDEYQGTPQIKIYLIRMSEESDNISLVDFLPKSVKDPDEMETALLSRIGDIKNSYLKKLLQNVFKGDRLKKFKIAPAGKSWHHGYIHGLIEHTLELIKICDLMCDFHSVLNRDLLISGALLHDFGKTEELSYDSSFEYTNKGKLVGHIVMCASMIEEEIKSISGFPEELKDLLLHLVLSHQGKLEYASPVVPKTAEAIALYQTDELSAKVNAYIGAINSDMAGEGSWTKFNHLAQTDLFKSGFSKEEEKDIKSSLFE